MPTSLRPLLKKFVELVVILASLIKYYASLVGEFAVLRYTL